MLIAPKPYLQLVCAVEESRDLDEVARLINEEGLVMISVAKGAEADDYLFCLGKLDLNRLNRK